MLKKLWKDFSRFFFHTPVQRTFGMNFGSFGFNLFSRPEGREQISEIVKDSLYLSNFPRTPLPSHGIVEEQSALVVSCVDLKEMMRSDFLLEPDNKFKYHVLPMEDVTAEPGCIEHIIDSILLMSDFVDKGKKIHVHCMQGVGRSAMITAIFLAYRYMKNDKTATDSLAPYLSTPLDINDEQYVEKLYKAACNYVSSKRPCCQFNDMDRLTRAIEVLKQLKENPEQKRDESYSFLTQFVHSKPFKRLVHSYFRNFDSDINNLEQVTVLKSNLRDFFDSLLLNKAGWYAQLQQASTEDCPDTNPLVYLSLSKENRLLLCNLLNIINELITDFPNAEYSKQINEQKLTVVEEQASVETASYTM